MYSFKFDIRLVGGLRGHEMSREKWFCIKVERAACPRKGICEKKASVINVEID